jgi:Gas vesicle synthesis protein GvpO
MQGSTSSSKGRAGDDAATRPRHPGESPDDRGEGRREPARGPDRRREGGDDRRNADAAPPRRISGSSAVEHAITHLTQFTGQPIEGVSSLNRTRDGGWRVVLEALELERIPRTTDILASYAVELDDHGELMGYERIHRYYRNDVDGDQ